LLFDEQIPCSIVKDFLDLSDGGGKGALIYIRTEHVTQEMSMADREHLTIYLTKEARQQRLLERLRRAARKQRRSLNFLVIEALKRYLEELEREQKERR